MEFKGTKGYFKTKYVQGFIRIVDENENNVIDTPWKHLNEANAKLIESAPEMFEEYKNEIEFLKRIKNQLEDAGLSMKYEVEERIEYLKQLLTKITE